MVNSIKIQFLADPEKSEINNIRFAALSFAMQFERGKKETDTYNYDSYIVEIHRDYNTIYAKIKTL